ncbi:unnamed protein product [Dicrocoelium dendriticum]|nr:unnamed protein product [Dicrocoelium dendriticum]
MQSRPRIQIGISCTHIPYIDAGTYAKLSVTHGEGLHEKHVTETEVLYESSYPVFTTRLNVEYYFEEKQIITVDILHCKREDREDSIRLGYVTSTIGRVVHCGGQLELPLTFDESQEKYIEVLAPENITTVILCIREDPYSKENIYLKMQGHSLDKKDLFGKSDPYVIIYRRNERGRLQRTYRSEVIKNTLFPDFRPILVCLDRLCGGNIDCNLCFRCFDWDGAVGDSEEVDTELDDLIGEFTTTIRELLKAGDNGIDYQLINHAKKKRKRYYQNSGQLNVRLFFAQSKYSFLDYIFGGTSINVVVGVDLSNHTMVGQMPADRHVELARSCNEYGVAIQAVMEILQEYDSDQLFPAYGFGSRLSTGGKICHKYPLSGDSETYFCKGMDGVLEAYRRSFDAVHLSGPVCFSPIIRDVSESAKQSNGSENYYVLLILTNGTVDDWVETKKAVIETSFLPISIIVIGVGPGRFSDMEILDQDFGLLKVGQDQACRDNVQFVEMRRFLRMAADGTESLRWGKVGLAKEVLAELPTQIMQYFQINHLTPCHNVPGQPETLQDLCDPIWWGEFTLPAQFDKHLSGKKHAGSEDSSPASSNSKVANKRGSLQEPLIAVDLSAFQTCMTASSQRPSIESSSTELCEGDSKPLVSPKPLRSTRIQPPNRTSAMLQSRQDSEKSGENADGSSVNPEFPRVRRHVSIGPSVYDQMPSTYRSPTVLVSKKPKPGTSLSK